MEYFYLYIFGLIFFIVAVSYYNTYYSSFKEGLGSGERGFLLMGDSILKNDAYVPQGKSIYDLLKKKFKDNTSEKVAILARDESNVVDVYNQMERIPSSYRNNNNTIIFLAVGGNDILNTQQKNGETTKEMLTPIFDNYKKLVGSIREILPDATLYLFDLYYPRDKKYDKYYPIIQEWNNMVFNFALDKNIKIFKISNMLTQPEDFTQGLEPSAIGSEKIVDEMLKIY